MRMLIIAIFLAFDFGIKPYVFSSSPYPNVLAVKIRNGISNIKIN